ncbi:MAG TPA: hypothetical protein VFR40_15570, partial [Lapillicoccus sp.]|nr:hypothetical protein [Lapillicoccus sp.]
MGLVEPPELPTHEIQADIIPGFRRRQDVDYAQHFLLLSVRDRTKARAELAALLPELTTAAAAVRPPGGPARSTSTNVGFTFAGLRELSPNAGLDDAFADHAAFRAGLAQRSRQQVEFEQQGARFDLLGSPDGWRLVDSDTDANGENMRDGMTRRVVRAVLTLGGRIGRRADPVAIHAVLNLGGRTGGDLADHVAAIRTAVAGGFAVVC